MSLRVPFCRRAAAASWLTRRLLLMRLPPALLLPRPVSLLLVGSISCLLAAAADTLNADVVAGCHLLARCGACLPTVPVCP